MGNTYIFFFLFYVWHTLFNRINKTDDNWNVNGSIMNADVYN